MGHAGAIISGGGGWENKRDDLSRFCISGFD
ncbi:MAG: hypothetical protein C5S45_00055 [Candidatus Methanocomedens sp.]|nr:MAG: hypothetical protein C5S45_00055 [ANME-2 cluster archaeon]